MPPFCKQQYIPFFVKFSSTQSCALNVQGPWVSGIELPGSVIHNYDLPISVLGVSMAGKNFVNSQFCVARINSQSLLQCCKKREDFGSGQLKASLLSAENVGSLAGLGPGCVVVVVIGDFHWRPETLE